MPFLHGHQHRILRHLAALPHVTRGTLLAASHQLTYSDVEIASHSIHNAKFSPSDIGSALNSDFRKRCRFANL